MRFPVISTTIAFFATMAMAIPSQSLNGLLDLDLTDPNLGQTLSSIFSQLPIDMNLWAFNYTDGIIGLDMNLDVAELTKLGLASVGPRSANARIDINVTITGLE